MQPPDWCAGPDQFVGQASGVELLQGSRVDAESAAQVGFAIASLQHRDIDFGLGEITREQEPGRASPDHHNVHG